MFDTAFHRTLPEHAWRYAVPDSLYTNHGIRRYGFHGTSHEYVTHRAAALLDLPVDEFDGVIAHLGNGASVTAIRGGKSVDTSMGFTPLEGLVMGTRSGDLDPSILVFLGRAGWTPEDIDTMLNRESGLKGLAGNNDMRSVVEASEAGDAKASMALAVTSYRLAKYIGGYHVAVGGAKALVFTAGIGENSHQFRALVADKLGALGIELDAGLNSQRSKEPRVISTAESAIPVLVVPTDEERAIAEATAAVVRSAGCSRTAGLRARNRWLSLPKPRLREAQSTRPWRSLGPCRISHCPSTLTAWSCAASTATTLMPSMRTIRCRRPPVPARAGQEPIPSPWSPWASTPTSSSTRRATGSAWPSRLPGRRA